LPHPFSELETALGVRFDVDIPPPTPSLAPPHAKPKELEVFPLAAHHSGLLLIQFEPAGRHPSVDSLHQALPLSLPAEDHKVVGVSNHLRLEFTALVYGLIQSIQIQICQKR